MSGVFINYRVADMAHGASHIDLELIREFGADQVFRDCRSMEPGEHYPTALRDALKDADVLVAVIGPEWLEVRNKETGVRRIDEEGDWVRDEIHEAMSRDMPVIPVLLQGAEKVRRLTAEDLPEQIRGFAYLQSLVIDFRRYEEDIKRLIARVAKLVPQVVLAKLFAVPEADPEPDNAPSTLLRPEYRAVPLIGRGEAIADLMSWANQPAACTAGLVVGPAGSGKTRLAQALCAELRTQGWLAGIVSGQAPAGKIGHTSGIDKPLLAVVDDVELRTDQLVALAGAMGDRSAARNAPARLLLLGRSAGDWLTDLCRHRDPQVSELFKTIGQDSTVTLRAEPGRRQDSFTHAFTSFAERFDLPAATPVPICPATSESLVDTQAAALVAVLERAGHAEPVDGQPDPLVRLLVCDQAHWTDESGLSGSGLAMLATVATLCPPASDEQALALLSRLPAFHADDHHPVQEYAQRLRRLYPGPYELNPIRPAALGERLIVITLEIAPALVTVLADTGTDEQLRTALTVLGRALPRHSSLSEAVENLLRVDPSRLTPLAVEVVARFEDPEPFVRAIVSVMGDGNLSKTAVIRLTELIGTVRRESLNPVKAKLLRALQEVFAGPIMDLSRHNVAAQPGLVPLQEISDRLVKLLMDGAEWFFDPKGSPIPELLDGGGNPMLATMVDMLRELTINRDWWRDDDEPKK